MSPRSPLRRWLWAATIYVGVCGAAYLVGTWEQWRHHAKPLLAQLAPAIGFLVLMLVVRAWMTDTDDGLPSTGVLDRLLARKRRDDLRPPDRRRPVATARTDPPAGPPGHPANVLDRLVAVKRRRR